MSFELEGKLQAIFETKQVSDSFKKREFVVKTEKQVGESIFTESIKFQLSQDRCSLLDTFNEGDSVKVTFNLRGKEWVSPKNETVFFNTLDAWKLVATVGATAPPPADVPTEEPHDDDLPF